MPTCPLCDCSHTRHFHRDGRRDYFRCENCWLAFVPPEQRLSPKQEKAVYDQHQNRPDDPEYRRFLSRLFEPLRSRLAPGARGLDFGAGPGPTLSLMFEEAGHPMVLFDPFYAPAPDVLERRYDFITASEVVEHLFAPGVELRRLAALLPEGGWLGLMTKRLISEEAFASWHYILDPTHVCFFSEASFEWLAQYLDMRVEFPAVDVALLQKR